MITEDVSTVTHLKVVMKGSLPFAIDVHMVSLVGCFAIRQYPCEFVYVWKMVHPITQLLVAQKSVSLPLLSFITPHPCVPVTLLWLVLSAPTLVLSSPIIGVGDNFSFSVTKVVYMVELLAQ